MKKRLLMLGLISVTSTVSAAPIVERVIKLDRSISSVEVSPKSLPELKSAMAFVYDQRTGQPLYEKKSTQQAPIASITKLMTAMVVLDARLALHETIRISRADMDKIKGTRSRLKVGTELTRNELLRLALMSSENRAAAALARTYPGGKAAAIEMMNLKARQLGMVDTHFVESTGLSSKNVSTAQDLVKLVEAAVAYPLIHRYTTTAKHAVNANGRKLNYSNTNPLVKNASWNIGVSKTGFINEAGRCLVMEATLGRRPVIIVLLNSWGKATRVADARRIKKWVESEAIRRF